MKEKNLEWLKENLKNMGFGDKLYKDLEINMRSGIMDFQLPAEADFNGDKMEALLVFRKIEEIDMYFFNSYLAALVKSGAPEIGRSQVFRLRTGYGPTFKEAYNLLEGRAVNKDLINPNKIKYNAWLQLDFAEKDQQGNHKLKKYYLSYGFDIEKVLDRYPIKELGQVDDRELLVRALKKGNLQPVSFEKDGLFKKMFIEANPKLRTLNVYDFEKKLVHVQTVKETRFRGRSSEQAIGDVEKKEKSADKKQEHATRREKEDHEPEEESQQRVDK